MRPLHRDRWSFGILTVQVSSTVVVSAVWVMLDSSDVLDELLFSWHV
jgi:hypothetical protein